MASKVPPLSSAMRMLLRWSASADPSIRSPMPVAYPAPMRSSSSSGCLPDVSMTTGSPLGRTALMSLWIPGSASGSPPELRTIMASTMSVSRPATAATASGSSPGPSEPSTTRTLTCLPGHVTMSVLEKDAMRMPSR